MGDSSGRTWNTSNLWVSSLYYSSASWPGLLSAPVRAPAYHPFLCHLVQSHSQSLATFLTCRPKICRRYYMNWQRSTVSSPYVIVLDALSTKLVYANFKGEVTYLNIFGQPTLVVDSYDAAFALLEN